MTDHDRNEFINLFNVGFEQVVLPHIERIDEKLENVENRLEGVENRLETVESRLDVVEEKWIRS